MEAALETLAPDLASARSLVHDLALDQTRLLDAPEAAAARIVQGLTRRAPAGGLFKALHDAWEHWFDRGCDSGLTYDLTLALHLARANLDRSKAVQRRQALGDLGITQFHLAEAEGSTRRFTQATATFRTFLAEHPRKADPDNWATGQVNLGTTLTALGKREPGTERLEQALTAYRAALEVQTEARAPQDRAATLALLSEAEALLAARQSAGAEG
jgi:tetratricopeptide (TPR) repeat protein